MSFEEIFNQGAAHATDQQNLDKVRPATEVVGEAPPRHEDDAIAGLFIPAPDVLPPFEPRLRRDEDVPAEDD